MSDSEKIEEIARKIQSDYHKKWRAKNKEKVKKTNKKYWLNKAKKEIELNKKED